ncbi:unnamed protein product [Phytophthora fragariaefolia]|uniref:Unnamed protein product n=1 Tax=Phytophthora fragariaefolia TaxID=1490495 RepID=A0A9W7CNF9_9STRA|nr:unnamed protein product [Phytophthora fragariaefolia]
MGFTYAPVIHESQLYNPLFYSYLGSDGSLTDAYAQTLFLSRNDYRLSYISGITLGIATVGVALVPGPGGNISGIGAISCSSLTVNGSSVVAPPSYVIGITEGSAAASKALVLDSMLDVSGINSLSATNLAGTLQTAAQPNITSVGTLTSLSLSGGISGATKNSVSSSTNTTITNSYSLWIANGKVLIGDGTSSSSTTTGALVINGGVGIGGQLTASTIAGTLQTAAQTNITSLGTLSSLTVSGGLSSATLTGTIQTSSQPNITSLGTLSSLTVSGGLSSATITGTNQTSSQPNITSLGDLTNLNVRSGATTGEIANISMPAQAAGYSSWITTGKSSSGNEGGRIGYYHDSKFANQYLYITDNNKSPFFVLSNNSCVGINTLSPSFDLDVVGQTRITGTLLLAGAARTISNVASYSGGTITTSGDITCGGSLKGYLGYGNQSTISTVGVLTEVAIGSTGEYNSQEYLLINGNGSNYLDGSYTWICSFYGSNITPVWFQIEVSNGSKTVSTSATWLGNNSDTDLRFGTNNSTYGICLGGTNRGRWGFGTTSPAYGVHNTLTVSTTLDAAGSGVAYFLKSGGLVSTLDPLSAIPIGIGTVGALLAGSGVYRTSDARIKKDWTELSDDVCAGMLSIKPLLFRYKTDGDSVPLQVGYRAQDLLRENLLHCINFTHNADMHVEDLEVDTEGIQYSVDYSKMVCLLHLLVLRQQKEINELKSLISE